MAYYASDPYYPSYLTTLDGEKIVVDARVGERLSKTRGLISLIIEAAERTRTPTGSDAELEVDLGRTIGEDACIEAPRIGLDDPATFILKSTGRGAVRVVTHGSLAPTQHLSMIISRVYARDRPFRLIDAWIGPFRHSQPWDVLRDSMGAFTALDFWESHAILVRPDTTGIFQSTFRSVISKVWADGGVGTS